VSTATPTPADWEIAAPWIAAYRAGELDRRGYWHGVQAALRQAHTAYSGHDVTRVARIMAPFPLQDDRYAPR
jgi:hypothetical protein